MSDDITSTTPETATEGETSSVGFNPTSYDIAPEDTALADTIRNFDPVFDTVGPVTGGEAMNLPETLSLDALNDDLRSRVEVELEGIAAPQREAATPRLVAQALYENAYEIRIAGGPGEDANDYQREQFAVLNDQYEIQQQIARIDEGLVDVIRWEPRFDELGKPIAPEAIFRTNGPLRDAEIMRKNELSYRLKLLRGSEGERRLQKALYETVQQTKILNEAEEIEVEAKALAASNERQKRVEERAASHAKFLRTER